MFDGQLVAFLGIAFLLIVTPGPDLALITGHALAHGRPAAVQVSAGILTGLCVWAGLSAVGVAALLAASAEAFALLKFAGGAYLVYLGAMTLWRARRRPASDDAVPEANRATGLPGRRAFRQGLLSNLLNPKVGVFYTSFLPQFVGPDDPVLAKTAALAFLHIAMSVVLLALYVRAVSHAADLLRRPRVRLWLDRTTGAVLVALGLRLATERR